MRHLKSTAQIIRVSALALMLMTMALATPVQANPIANWLGGKATKAYYERTGHVCAKKPGYLFLVPTFIWYNATCAKVAR